MTYDEFTHQSLETTSQIGCGPKVYFGICIEFWDVSLYLVGICEMQGQVLRVSGITPILPSQGYSPKNLYVKLNLCSDQLESNYIFQFSVLDDKNFSLSWRLGQGIVQSLCYESHCGVACLSALEGECRDLSADCWACNHLPYLNAKVKLIQSKNAWSPA